MSPTARTLIRLRSQGYIAEKVEQTIPHTFIKRDFLGFIDILAIGKGHILGVQATSQSNITSRIAKIEGECRVKARRWLSAGGLIEVWGWRTLKQEGSRRRVWEPDIRSITTVPDGTD
jgi:hypothetical protein